MVTELPVLETDRLRLRPFALSDAPDVQRLAGSREVAATTLLIPHPYPDGAAEEWISSQRAKVATGSDYVFAITSLQTQELMGAIGLHRNHIHNKAEIGYWIGVPYWGQGYCTEAARRVVEYGFQEMLLNRIHACHFTNNPASGRVMQKIGLIYEGTMRQDLYKWGEYIDHSVYGITRTDYMRTNEELKL